MSQSFLNVNIVKLSKLAKMPEIVHAFLNMVGRFMFVYFRIMLCTFTTNTNIYKGIYSIQSTFGSNAEILYMLYFNLRTGQNGLCKVAMAQSF